MTSTKDRTHAFCEVQDPCLSLSLQELYVWLEKKNGLYEVLLFFPTYLLMTEYLTKSHCIYAVSIYNPRIKFVALPLSSCQPLEGPWTGCHTDVRKLVITCGKLVFKHWSLYSSLVLNGMGKTLRNSYKCFFLPVTFLGTRQGNLLHPDLITEEASKHHCFGSTALTTLTAFLWWNHSLRPKRLQWFCCSLSCSLSFLCFPRVKMETEVIHECSDRPVMFSLVVTREQRQQIEWIICF